MTDADDRRGRSATGMNAGPSRRPADANPDAVQGTTSAEEPELRGKPRAGTRLDADT